MYNQKRKLASRISVYANLQKINLWQRYCSQLPHIGIIFQSNKQFDEILADLDQNNTVIDKDYFFKIHNNNK